MNFGGTVGALPAWGGRRDLGVTVELSDTMGSATLVYQIDRTGGLVTVSRIDITSSSGLAAITTALAAGAPVKVYGVPQAPVAPRRRAPSRHT